MEVIYERCAGLDVHKKTVVACRVDSKGNGRKEQETRTFGTTTAELLGLVDWLIEWGCTHVAMESTGEYWKPVYNLLEGEVEILLVNAAAHQSGAGPQDGRGRCGVDSGPAAAWAAASELRSAASAAGVAGPDTTAEQLGAGASAVLNRLQKVLEGANIKLASVTKAGGVSAREMVKAIVEGESDAAVLAEMARGRLRTKRGSWSRR